MIPGPCRILLAGLCIAGAGLAFRFVPVANLREAGAAPQAEALAASQQAVVPAAPGLFVGAGSCAAAACHGGKLGRDSKGSEYSIWIQSDRHAIAYTTLFSRRSQSIARNLGLKQAAHTAGVCLKCHSLAADPAETAAGRASVLADGVSCEACHGAAEHWLEPHKRRDWKSRSADEKSLAGFADTSSILTRTIACLRCHVGGQGRDVDHDLIAAGHPRLYFEMSTYFSQLPAHWDRARDHQDHPALEARLWTVGQFAAADAALGLLEHRSSSKLQASWPEFAEYACFACHHDLAAPDGRQSQESRGPPGRYRWGSWNFALVEGLARTRDGAAAAAVLQSGLELLEKKMQEPFPAPAAVAEQARALRTDFQKLAQAAERADYSSLERQRLMMYLLGDVAPHATRDWEASTQLYLALAALARTDPEPAKPGTSALKPEVRDELQRIRDLLRFPADGTVRFSSPRDFDATRTDELSNHWLLLRQMIEEK